MNLDALRKSLIAEEGEKLSAYQDHLGYWTIGVGRLIDDRKGGGISKDESQFMLGNDIRKFHSQLSLEMPWIATLDDARQNVLIAMAFQMGTEGLLKFRGMLTFLRNREYNQAATAGLQSNWARQTPARAKRMMDIIRTGVLPQ